MCGSAPSHLVGAMVAVHQMIFSCSDVLRHQVIFSCRAQHCEYACIPDALMYEVCFSNLRSVSSTESGPQTQSRVLDCATSRPSILFKYVVSFGIVSVSGTTRIASELREEGIPVV